MFTYPPLTDPPKQFRLLSFDTSCSETHLSLHLKTYNMARCPQYVALSYVYGDPSARDDVVVNGDATDLNRNGYQALQQARAQGRAGFYWMDSLCINQIDLAEKAVQVHRIGAIFKGAAEVWACFGSHSDDSRFFFQTLADFPLQSERDRSVFERFETTQMRWLLSLGGGLARFVDALKEFGHRSFFSRMWTYQEMYLAQRVNWICGMDMVSESALERIVRVCWISAVSFDNDTQQALEVLLNKADPTKVLTANCRDFVGSQMLRLGRPKPFGQGDTGSQGLSSFVRIADTQHEIRLKRLRCQDPRDKVFSLINTFTTCNIRPDYGMSCFDLALLVLGEYKRSVGRAKLAYDLCWNLELYQHVEEVESASAPNSALGAGLRHQSGNEDRRDFELTEYAHEIWVQLPRTSRRTHAAKSRLQIFEQGDQKRRAFGQYHLAIATCDLAAGDWIAPLHCRHEGSGHPTPGLVFRKRMYANIYHIVGEVAFLPHENGRAPPGPSFRGGELLFDDDSGTRFLWDIDRIELLQLSSRLCNLSRAMHPNSAPGPPDQLAMLGPPKQWGSCWGEREGVSTSLNYNTSKSLWPESEQIFED